jgi:hypothetical protein
MMNGLKGTELNAEEKTLGIDKRKWNIRICA